MSGRFEIHRNGSDILHEFPPEAKGLEDQYSGVAYLPRAYLMRWAVTCSGLNAQFNLPPTAQSSLRNQELRLCREARHGVPMFRFTGKDGPFGQEYGLHFCLYETADQESAAMQPAGLMVPVTPR